MPKDYYDILEVSRKSSPEEIKKNYRRLAKKYHPDVNKNDKKAEEKFKEISQAYDILGDPEKKKKYDQFGEFSQQSGFDPRHQAYQQYSWTSGPGGGGGGRGGPSGSGGVEFDLGDIFGNLFGMGGGRRGGQSPGGSPFGFEESAQRSQPETETISATVDISFDESLRGTTRRLTVTHGRKEEKIDVKIPAGIKDGGKVRLSGKGGRGGDLFIRIKVAPHPYFWREDDDLYVEIPITVTEAVLGATVKVQTLDAAVNLKIPPATSSGQKFRLPGKGAPHLGKTGVGDQYVVVKIVVPPHMDDETKEEFKKLHEKLNYNPR